MYFCLCIACLPLIATLFSLILLLVFFFILIFCHWFVDVKLGMEIVSYIQTYTHTYIHLLKLPIEAFQPQCKKHGHALRARVIFCVIGALAVPLSQVERKPNFDLWLSGVEIPA